MRFLPYINMKGGDSMAKKLNERQRKLAENLAKGMSELQAYIQAGFNDKWAEKNASTHIKKLRNNKEFSKYFDSLLAPERNKRIKSVDDVQEFWASVLDDPDASYQDKLKASEYIAKSRGMFVNQQKVELSGGLPVFIRDDVNE